MKIPDITDNIACNANDMLNNTKARLILALLAKFFQKKVTYSILVAVCSVFMSYGSTLKDYEWQHYTVRLAIYHVSLLTLCLWHRGLFELTHMPICLSNASQMF